MRTGMIGLGAMGMPIAANLRKAGYLAAAWNRTRAKAEALAGQTGAAIAPTPAELAAQCKLILISVSADQDLREVIDALLPGLSPNSVVVDTSTVSAQTARQVAQQLARKEAHFLDAPVTGGVEGAKNARLSMMVGGDAAVLERVRPALEAIAQRIVHMGPAGSGQMAKAVNQIMAAGINQAVTEALAFAKAAGLSLDKVIEAVSGGAAGNWFLSHRGPAMVRDNFTPGFRLALHHKDLSICKQMASDLGAQLPLVEMTLIHYRHLMEAGYGDEDISALFRLKQQLFGEKP
ncbi:MAG: NAD(P)-dependent oxidoreductase [Gammaproteobacteria bacterium]|nr:NAD(P)-dependent oxidoreductase [Gammaproteobacteria bacterium]